MNRYIFIFLLLPIFFLAQSDYDKDQQDLYTSLFNRNLKEAKALIDGKFLKSEDKSRQIIGYVYLAQYYKYANEKDSNDKLIKAVQTAKKIATETENEIDEGYAEYGNTLYYRTINKWDLFVKSLEKSIRIFEEYPNENFMLALLYHSKLNVIDNNPLEKRNITDYKLANKFAKQSKNSLLISSSYNDIGNFYSYQLQNVQKNHRDSSRIAYNKSLEIASQVQDSDAKKKLQYYYYTNIGLIYLDEKKYSEALKHYDKGLQLYKNDKDTFYLFSLYNNIGYTYALMKHNITALEYYLKAESMLHSKQVTNANKITLYLNIYQIYEKLKIFDKALEYDKKSRETITEEDKRQYENNIKSLEAFYQTEQEKNILADRNKIYKKYEIWYISAIISTALGIIFLFFTLHYRQMLNKRTTSLLESEKEKLKIEHELSMIKQEQLQRQALVTSIQLDRKNILINELKVNIPQDTHLHHLLKDEQLVDSHFNTIRNIIQETHPYFFKRLNELAKDRLTNLDLKYAAYIYLNMDNIQIATTLKVDPKTVSVTKYRLKQKLGIDKGEDLNKFICNLNM